MRRLLAILCIALLWAVSCVAENEPEPWRYVVVFPESNIGYLNVDDLHIDYEGNIEIKTSNMLLANEILTPTDFEKTCVPGRMPTFAFVGTISAIGTYTLYGAGAGIVTAGLVYVCTNGNRHHTKMAIWGCVTGMVVGGFAKWLSVR